MKLGVITFHSVINYGSAIQAYAMQEGIAKLGVETEIIDYRGHNVPFAKRVQNNIRYIFSINKWKRYIGNKFRAKKIYAKNEDRALRRNNKFEEFRKIYFRTSGNEVQKEDLAELNGYYDAFVCGSDQIWNPTYIGHDMSYFLDFVTPDWKRIAYAPSVAVNGFDSEYSEEIKREVSKFVNISVREKESVDLINKLTGKKATVVVDPTMLLTSEEWRRIECSPADQYTNEPYIFCYFLGANKEYCKYVEHLKDLTGLKVVLVTCTDMKVYSNFGDEICDDIGPSEFLYLIDHAKYVCTDSFHGTVFSLLFHKDFFTFKRYKDNILSSENSRLYTLLSMVENTNRMVQSTDDIDELIKCRIDYSLVDSELTLRINGSILFLRNEIGRVNNIR